MTDLKNRVAFVTGGASGLGAATVRELARQGCKVAIADMNEETGKALVSEIGEKSVAFYKVNVTNEKEVETAIKSAAEKFGGLSIVVNCAGIIHTALILGRNGLIKTEDMRRVLDINVIGTLNVSKYAAEIMSKQPTLNKYNERGVIINISSIAGFEGQDGQTTYSASKAAIMGMTMPMARELGKYGIRVVALAPGLFKTPMTSNIKAEVNQKIASQIALGRQGEPAEFADAVVGIIGCSYMTGEIVRLDGATRLGKL